MLWPGHFPELEDYIETKFQHLVLYLLCWIKKKFQILLCGAPVLKGGYSP